MTTSEYLKIQADLLQSVALLRRLPLEAFIEHAAAADPEQPMRDALGYPVRTQPANMAAIARCAQEMCTHGPLAPRKDAGREEGIGKGKEAVA